MDTETCIPSPAALDAQSPLDVRLKREWLITNGRGGYASGTIIGVPTRGYHGLLVAAARPPLERWLLLASVLERVVLNGRILELASFEFQNAIHPTGYLHLTDFHVSNRAPVAGCRFVYGLEQMRLTKDVLMPRDDDRVVVRYRLDAPHGGNARLELAPFTAMRDFHARTRALDDGFHVDEVGDQVAVDAHFKGPRLWLRAERLDDAPLATFERCPEWWYGFVHREEASRGLGDRDDYFVPGWFTTQGEGTIELALHAIADFSGTGTPPPRIPVPAWIPSEIEPTVEDRLHEAADGFVVVRRRPDGGNFKTILAGYHWFGDWGRDALIALPGLLLETHRFGNAREVLATFAAAQQDGLIPNRFSDYGEACDYNSVDASLWFIHAADAYCTASGDANAWPDLLGPACERVAEAFIKGTRFNIRADDDGLVTCGDASTQLTWMDAKAGDVVFTPRHGKPVEINALWYHALCILGDRMAGSAGPPWPARAAEYRSLARRVREAFVRAFWNDDDRCLYDVVHNDHRDPSIRPNQIFAVSLPHSPLDEALQASVLQTVERHLLTPYGLRSLSPNDPSYRGRYEGPPFQRDSAYHQGTVWGWLMGPYVEAYLRVHRFTPDAKSTMRELLSSLIGHLDEAGLGSVSEVFDGDPPHTPGGCIAQAWSVAELLRAYNLTRSDVDHMNRESQASTGWRQ